MYRNLRSPYSQNAIFNIKSVFLLYYRLTILVLLKCLRMFVPVPVGYVIQGWILLGWGRRWWREGVKVTSGYLRVPLAVDCGSVAVCVTSEPPLSAGASDVAAPTHDLVHLLCTPSLYWHERGRLISSHHITSPSLRHTSGCSSGDNCTRPSICLVKTLMYA